MRFSSIRSVTATAVIGILLVSHLSGCVGLAATGAAVGVMAATDRRSIGTQTDDQAIELRAFARLQEALKNPGGVSATSYNRKVLLTGQVLDQQAKEAAGRAVASIEGVKGVYNELEVTGRASIGTQTADTVTTTRVKAAFVEAKNIESNAIKVVTEKGVVYLMGIVTREEQERAAQIASRVSGVQKVVTLFDLVSAAEVKAMESGRRN